MCKELAWNSFSPPESKSSMQKEASRTSRSAASPAATLERTQREAPESISPQHVLVAEARQRFPSSPSLTDLYIAANALLNLKKTVIIAGVQLTPSWLFVSKYVEISFYYGYNSVQLLGGIKWLIY